MPQTDEAKRLYEQAIDAYRAGEYEEALEILAQAREVFVDAGNQTGEVEALGSMGVVYVELEEWDQAQRRLDEALALCVERQDRTNQAKVLGNLIYRPNVVEVEGNYDDVNRLCSEIAAEHGWAFVNINIRPYYAEGSKTLAFETVEQLGWRAPAHVVVPMASGSLLTKIWKGLNEMRMLGLVDEVRTRVNGAQAEGCSPIATAFREGHDFFRPVKPKTIAKSLAIGNPADGYYALKATAESGGAMDAVSDDEVVEGIKLLAQTEGIFAETAGGVTVGVLRKLVKQGVIKRNELTVAYITGNGLKTQEAVIDAVGRPVRIQPSLVSFERTFKMGKNGGGDA